MSSVYSAGDPESILTLTGLIDEGSIGAVFAAEMNGTLLAIKVVPLEDAAVKQEIENEIRLLQKCSKSVYIVGFHGAWTKDDHAWVALELCEAGSVIDLIQISNHTLSLNEARSVCASTLLAMAHLHGLGIVHRDIKGKNVLLTRKGRVKLADLGVAFDVASTAEPEAAGSPHWMAPEAARGEKPAPSNDCWALGIMLIELIEGAPPHASIEPLKVLDVIRNAPPPILRRVPAWGPELSNLISACLEKDAKKRASSKELLTHPFLDTEIMKALISGAPSHAIVALVDESMAKIIAFREFQASSGASEDTAPEAEAEVIDYNARDSIVRVPLSLEDRLRQEQMSLIFNLAQRYSLKGGEAALIMSGASGELKSSASSSSAASKSRARKHKSVKITKLKGALPLLTNLDQQLHDVFKKAFKR